MSRTRRIAIGGWLTVWFALGFWAMDAKATRPFGTNNCDWALATGDTATPDTTLIVGAAVPPVEFTAAATTIVAQREDFWGLRPTDFLGMCWNPPPFYQGDSLWQVEGVATGTLSLSAVFRISLGVDNASQRFVSYNTVGSNFVQQHFTGTVNLAPGECIGFNVRRGAGTTTYTQFGWSLYIKQLECEEDVD